MLNRRILRVKVMQALYGLTISKQANYHLGLEDIAHTFAPDLLSPEPQDIEKLSIQKSQASALYEHHFHPASVKRLPDPSVDVAKAFESGLNEFHKQNEDDVKRCLKDLRSDVGLIYEEYIVFLRYLASMPAQMLAYKADEDKKFLKQELPEYYFKLKDSKAALILESNHTLANQQAKVLWSIPDDFARRIFREVIVPSAEFQEYRIKPQQDFDSDLHFLQDLFKTTLLKNDIFLSFFESKDINWVENRTIVRGMVLKTLKSISSESDSTMPLLELSANWEEDETYFMELYKLTLKEDDRIQGLLSNKVKNWDMDRLALVDLLIMKMAITEMMHFSSIPIKVTINEYIELSKEYSTPKSKQFVNGLLDNLSTELIRQGLVRKSGRGLIDNK
jgi:N utilization substance protein B